MPTPEQIATALQQAGQYANSANVLTPANAPEVGLDPSKGFIARGTPIAPAQPSPVPAPTPPKPAPKDDPEVEMVKPAPKVSLNKSQPKDDPEVEMVKPAEAPQTAQAQPKDDPEVEIVKPAEPKPPPTVPAPPAVAQQPPTVAGPVVPTEAETQQETQATQIQAQIKAGKSPGEAQAIVAGQQPKTLGGQPPQPIFSRTFDWTKPPAQPEQTTAQPEQPATQQPSEQAPSTKVGTAQGTRVVSTEFGANDNPALGGYTEPNWNIGAWGDDIANKNTLGVALPLSTLRAYFGDPNKAHNARVLLQADNGKSVVARILDKGPREGGAGIDLMYATARALGQPYNSSGHVTFKILGPGEEGKVTSLTAASQPSGPAKPTGPSAPLAQPQLSIPQGGGGSPQLRTGVGGGFPEVGGGGGAGYGGTTTPSSTSVGSVNLPLGSLAAGALGGAIASRAAAPQPSQAPPQEEPSFAVPKPALPGTALAATPQTGEPAMKPANVLGVRTVEPPPAAPSGQLALPAPPPAAPSGAPPIKIGVPKLKAPPPVVPKGGVDPTVVQGLMKQGFTREQAEAVAAKAQVSKPGAAARITGGATFRPGAQAPPPPAPPAPPSKPPPQQPGGAAPQPPPRKGSALVQALKEHAASLPPDDARVKKQRDGMTKGEHFVPGDPMHEELLGGLPGGQGGRQRQILAHAERAIADKAPMHISYISAPKEAALYPTRESRTIQYDEHSPEARLMGTTEGQLVGHSFIPVSVGISPAKKAGEPHQGYIQGISTNILANNHQHLNEKLAEMGQKSPYEKLDNKFYNDLEGYLSNLIAGHTGTGRGYMVGTPAYPSTPDENHVPYHLTRREADFLNATINNTMAFAKHQDAKNLRELARANGTLITEEGETNRIRHAIEQHEPGWRERVLEPSIRSFKTGLVHDVHPSEEHMPATIRPGQEFRHLTEAIARTTYRGRPDVPVSVSPRSLPGATMPRDLAQNKLINQIERDFSEDRINEEEARRRLHAIGENPDEYRFVGGSGGLITPYEEDPEAITPEEHTQLKDNLRKKWIGGQMPIEDYRRKVAEIPLPTRPAARQQASQPSQVATPAPAAPPKKPKPQPSPEPEETEAPEEKPAQPPKPPEPVTPPMRKPKPPVSDEPEEEPEESVPAPTKAKAPPPAPGDVLPAPKKPPKAKPAPVAPTPPAPRPITPETQKVLGRKPEDPKQAALWQQAGERLDTQVPEGIPLEVDRKENGDFKVDPKGKVIYKKTNYDLANAPLLQKEGKHLGLELNKKTGKMGMAKPPADVEDDLEELDPEKRLTPFLNPTDRKRVAHLHDISAVDTYADKLHGMYKSIAHLPEVMAGKDWYDEAVGLLRKHFGSHADLVANLLGATSAGNKVKINYNMAMDAYHQYLRGHYDDAIKLYNQAYDIQQSGKGALMKHILDNKIHEALGQDAPDTDERAMLQWIEHHNLTPRSSGGKLFGHNSLQVLKVLAHNWEKEAGGPKTPNFAANLSGRSLQATIDMWAARTMRRLGYEGHTKEPWMIQPAGETGINDVDFGLSQLAFRKAADKIGIKPSALQAILWFAEQKEWQKRGWEREQDPDDRDYRPMLKSYQRPMDISKAQAARYHPSVPELEARLGAQAA